MFHDMSVAHFQLPKEVYILTEVVAQQLFTKRIALKIVGKRSLVVL